ncbi:hypothetical protein D5018_09135 [Parashewanella curva]|uniref:Uncharacterized protein n=1 Tax=Parashewanella curva TaxID=2338552 RepID=A0A3L8PXB2_9GAMM|nr:hypothetical protein [Parashewanella curva]RLV59961.1 hypothetical protein D5018_09135 [Parashewanella curva]
MTSCHFEHQLIPVAEHQVNELRSLEQRVTLKAFTDIKIKESAEFEVSFVSVIASFEDPILAPFLSKLISKSGLRLMKVDYKNKQRVELIKAVIEKWLCLSHEGRTWKDLFEIMAVHLTVDEELTATIAQAKLQLSS